MSSEGSDRYAAAGVDYGVIDPGKVLAQRAAEATATVLVRHGLSEVRASRGESAYVVDFGDHYVTSVTEALGTKNLVADLARPITGRSHYDAIAQDTVATVLNDLATVGGFAVNLSAYWGAGDSHWFEDAERMADLVRGFGAACAQGGAAWGGGETQVLVGIINPAAVVLGGSAVGCIRPKARLLLGSRVRAGDAILFAPGTGIHANGLTLARKLAAELPQGYATVVPGDPAGRPLCEVLLDPAPLYGPLVHALQEAGVDLHYAAHITGHGWRKLMRAQEPFTYVIERLPAVNPVLDFLAQCAGMPPEESYATFNMGAGFALYVAAADVPRAQQVAAALQFELLHAGHVEAGPKRVHIAPLALTFEGAALEIR